VAGVAHELLLRAARRRERAHHRGEAAAQAPDLGRPVDRHLALQVLADRDVFGGDLQTFDRLHDPARQQPAEPHRREHAHSPDRREPQAQRREHVLVLVERACELVGTAGRRHRDDAVIGAVHLHRPQARHTSFGGQRAVLGVDRDRGLAFDARGHRAVGVDALRGGRGSDVAARRTPLWPREIAAAAPVLLVPAGWRVLIRLAHAGQARGRGAQRLVERGVESLRSGHVRRGRADQHNHRGDQPETEGDTPAQAHGSRAT
jgi:hypothetical protein